jgi:hypothetical protein
MGEPIILLHANQLQQDYLKFILGKIIIHCLFYNTYAVIQLSMTSH